MGWCFDTWPSSKKEFIENLTKDRMNETGSKKWVTEAQSLRGNKLWVIRREENSGDGYIILYLLASENKCWGYKDIDETMGPFHYNCPLKFLKMQPNVWNSNSEEWRKKVIQYYEDKKNSLKIRKGNNI